MGTLQNQDAARTCLLAMGIVCRTTRTIALTGCSRGSSISFRSSRHARDQVLLRLRARRVIIIGPSTLSRTAA